MRRCAAINRLLRLHGLRRGLLFRRIHHLLGHLVGLTHRRLRGRSRHWISRHRISRHRISRHLVHRHLACRCWRVNGVALRRSSGRYRLFHAPYRGLAVCSGGRANLRGLRVAVFFKRGGAAIVQVGINLAVSRGVATSRRRKLRHFLKLRLNHSVGAGRLRQYGLVQGGGLAERIGLAERGRLACCGVERVVIIECVGVQRTAIGHCLACEWHRQIHRRHHEEGGQRGAARRFGGGICG